MQMDASFNFIYTGHNMSERASQSENKLKKIPKNKKIK